MPSRASPSCRRGSPPPPTGSRGGDCDAGGAAERGSEMLKRNGIEAALAGRYPDRASREAEIRRQAVDWAQRWDANSLVILRRGTIGYNTVKDFAKIKAKILYVLCRTDRLFPPSIAPGVMNALPTPRGGARGSGAGRGLGRRGAG